MKFVITRTSDNGWRSIKDFKDLEDLLKYREKMGDDLIISDNHWKGRDPIDIMHFLKIEDIKVAKEISEIDYEIEMRKRKTIMEKISIFTTCPQCGCDNKVRVFKDDLVKWENGALAQDAFPYLSADEREMLISGICPKCWAEMFSDEED